jgi:predicted Zn finger-like uncharacterized protein
VQALCPQCQQKIVIDDAKVPDRAFNVRCPRCQTVVKLPGKEASDGAALAAPAFAPAPVASPTPPPPTPVDTRRGPAAGAGHSEEELRAQMMAQLRRELGGEGSRGPQALVVFPNAAQAAAITLTLTRLGYHVDTVDDFEDGARLLEQGVHDVVATARVAAAAGRPESLYQRMVRLFPDQRRRIFVILVGDEFKSGDGTQAFLVMADLVLSARDAGAADQVIRSSINERRRLYQAFEDARKKFEEVARA